MPADLHVVEHLVVAVVRDGVGEEPADLVPRRVPVRLDGAHERPSRRRRGTAVAKVQPAPVHEVALEPREPAPAVAALVLARRALLLVAPALVPDHGVAALRLVERAVDVLAVLHLLLARQRLPRRPPLLEERQGRPVAPPVVEVEVRPAHRGPRAGGHLRLGMVVVVVVRGGGGGVGSRGGVG